MLSCIFINDSNTISEIRVKNITCDNLYKKCNYKNNENFVKILEYNYEDNILELWGKNKGLNKYKNNHDFLKNQNIEAYGKCIIVMMCNNNYTSLNLSYFNIFYNNILNNKVNEPNKDNEYNEDTKDDEDISEEKEEHINEDKCSEYSYNSELSYDLYCYSDDENSL